MKIFLCSFAVLVAVVNGYATGVGNYGSSGGPVIAGHSYQLLPAISVPAISGGYGDLGVGYGSSSSIHNNRLLAHHGLSLVSAGAHGDAHGAVSGGKLAYAVAPALSRTPAAAHHPSAAVAGSYVGGSIAAVPAAAVAY